MAFILVVLILLLAWFVASQGFTNPVRWVRDNPGAWKGIRAVLLVVLIVSVVAALQGCTAVSMQAGIDHHYDGVSPQCERDSSDNRSTSNIGFRFYHYTTNDMTVYSNWQHHSCAFGSDSKEYNAFGIGVEQLIWSM